MYMLLFMLKFIMLMLMLLFCVALYTLLERKILGYVQIRKGPNKVGYLGLFQPLGDGAKLFLKEDMYPIYTNKYIYYFSPIYGMLLALLLMSFFPFCSLYISMKWGFLFFLCISSLSVYSLILGGWASMSKYSNMGSYRAVAQTISYEVGMSFILISFMLFYNTFSFDNLIMSSLLFYEIYIMLIIIWCIIILAETNRSPFDLSESESELVSGFNTEYSGGEFALIFIAEYSNMIMLSVLSVVILFNSQFMMLFMFLIYFLWVRSSYPRIRYDMLMYLSWKVYLPYIIGFLFFCIMLNSSI